MFNEEGMEQSVVLDELAKHLEADVSYVSGYPIASMSSTPHSLGIKVFCQTMEKNAGRYYTFSGARSVEQELIAMVGDLLHLQSGEGITTSGGTESNILALLAARETNPAPTRRPIVIAPQTIHSSIDKAAWLLGLKLVKTEVDDQYRAIPDAIKKNITENTIGIVATAGTTYLGQVDPIPEISEIAEAHQLSLHVDAAFGGFVLPFLANLGYYAPPFDFSIEGVTSISMDPHKMGLAPIPASTLTFRNAADLERITHRIPYLLGFSATQTSLLGTRPAGSILASWAIMKHLGRRGYQDLVKMCMHATMLAKEKVEQAPNLMLAINPVMNVLGIQLTKHQVLNVVSQLEKKGWRIAISPLPPSIRMVCMPHLTPRVIHTFFDDLDKVLK
ncbi:MAG: tyrosine decarboxylase MfnA [Candidatus Hodarchaeota archaeon]